MNPISISLSEAYPVVTSFSATGSETRDWPKLTYEVYQSNYEDNLNVTSTTGRHYSYTSTVAANVSKYDINDRWELINTRAFSIVRTGRDYFLNGLQATVKYSNVSTSARGDVETYSYTDNYPKAITTTQGLLSTYNIFKDSYNIVQRTVTATEYASTISYTFGTDEIDTYRNYVYLHSRSTRLVSSKSITYTFQNINSTSTYILESDPEMTLSLNGNTLYSTTVDTGNYEASIVVGDRISNDSLITISDVEATYIRDTRNYDTTTLTSFIFGSLFPNNQSSTYQVQIDTANSVYISRRVTNTGTVSSVIDSTTYPYRSIDLNNTSSYIFTSNITTNTIYFFSGEAIITPFISTVVNSTYELYNFASSLYSYGQKTTTMRSYSYSGNAPTPLLGVYASVTTWRASVYTAPSTSTSSRDYLGQGISTLHEYETGAVLSTEESIDSYDRRTETHRYYTYRTTYSWSWADISTSTTATGSSSSSNIVFLRSTLSTVDSYSVISRSDSYETATIVGYSTLYTGSILAPSLNSTSWKYVANQATEISIISNLNSASTIEYLYSTFGVNSSTTVSQSKLLSSTATTVDSYLRESYASYGFMKSTTISSLDIPYETTYSEYTYYTSGTKSVFGANFSIETVISTDYWGDTYTYSKSNYNVTVNYTSSDTVYSSSSTYNFSTSVNYEDYGTTYRLSTLISSVASIVPGAAPTIFYSYSYDIQSIWSYNQLMSTLSRYSTILHTSFTTFPVTRVESTSYDITASASYATRTSDERFDYRVEIYRTSSSNMSIINTVVLDDEDYPIATLSSETITRFNYSTQSVLTTSMTFKSSTADLSTMNVVTGNSYTTEAVRGNFKYSSVSLLSSTFEQQNETLIFASTFNSSSFYNNTTTYSTVNTVLETVSATTYVDWYRPTSWTESKTEQITSSANGDSVSVSSGSVSVTQTVGYTPLYPDVNGIYVTA